MTEFININSKKYLEFFPAFSIGRRYKSKAKQADGNSVITCRLHLFLSEKNLEDNRPVNEISQIFTFKFIILDIS